MNKPNTSSASTGSKTKPAASMLSTDLTIVGNLRTTGDIQVEAFRQLHLTEFFAGPGKLEWQRTFTVA